MTKSIDKSKRIQSLHKICILHANINTTARLVKYRRKAKGNNRSAKGDPQKTRDHRKNGTLTVKWSANNGWQSGDRERQTFVTVSAAFCLFNFDQMPKRKTALQTESGLQEQNQSRAHTPQNRNEIWSCKCSVVLLPRRFECVHAV